MQPTEPSPTIAIDRLFVFALLTSIATTCLATLYPAAAAVGHDGERFGVMEFGWIAAQSFLLTVPGVVAGTLIAVRWPRFGLLVGGSMIFSVVVVVLCDLVTFHWIGERFLSAATWRVFTSLRESLAGHVTSTMIVSGTALFIGCLVYATLAWIIAARVAVACSTRVKLPSSFSALLLCVVASVIVSLPTLWNARRTLQEMAVHSSRHPFCAFKIVAHRGVGRSAQVDEPSDPTKLTSFESAIAARDTAQRQLGVALASLDPTKRDLPADVVIVVIESFRHELVTPQVMPHLWSYAEKGILCRQHFSGGNATNHGMFSLLNGLEAIWYERGVRYSPLLNRLYRQAGYELGFFGGHNDWRKFQMDGYISDEHYDVFQTDQPDWLQSDRRATERAALFLDRQKEEERPPRLAVLYLYSTHANYHSFAKDQIFQPAADDRFLIPFSESAKPAVWNRYKNSARSIDRFLAAVMKQDRVIIVTGDHGESFLEDGVCGHGVRISKYQNMTPAIIYVPGGKPRVISEATMHADLLPTLLSATGIPTTRSDAFDGDDLITTSDGVLSGRLFATRNYLSDDLAIIGPWTRRDDQPFAYRASVSLRDLRADALNAIDETGTEQMVGERENSSEIAFRQWLEGRFGRL